MKKLLTKLYRGDTNIDFIGRRMTWFAISGVVLAICIGSLAIKQLNFGIEFVGGVEIQAPIPEDGPLGDASDLEVIAEIREVAAAHGASDAQVQVASDDEGRRVLVQSKAAADPDTQDDVVAAVVEALDAPTYDANRTGQTWGAEITRKARNALVVFLVVIFLFISWRFEWKMAVAAVAALIHDLIITAGVYSLVGFEVTPSTVVAILTIMGYSLYDTVVVFDKVEENTSQLAASGRTTYESAANLAMNQVFMRSLNTSLATLLPVGALLFGGAGLLGATTLKDLALALLVGILVGAYSSIFVATPILSIMKEREPRFQGVRERVLREAARASSPQQALTPAVAGAEGVPTETKSQPAMPKPAARPAARPRSGSKKAKRRKRR